MQPTDEKSHDTPPVQRPTDEDDGLSVVDFIDSVDRDAFRRALGKRCNYYPIPRAD